MPSEEAFYRDVMCPLRPVVVSDLFQDQPIREIRTREQAIEAFGSTQIAVQAEYGKDYQQGAANADGKSTYSLSLAKYYAFVDSNRDTPLMAIELPTPEPIRKTYQIPEVCRARPGESLRLVDQCFIGNRGNRAQIHFDKAGLHGFLYQVFGRKRVTYFPHEASLKLLPFTQIGGYQLHAFSEADRKAFLDFTGGSEVVLEPGDAYFVPLLSWHAVDYLEDSMSISLRFRRPQPVTTLVNTLFPDLFLQGIAAKLADPARAEDDLKPVLRRIEKALAERHENGRDLVSHRRNLAREIHRELYPSFPDSPYFLDLEEHFPPLLPHFLDANDPERPRYE